MVELVFASLVIAGFLLLSDRKDKRATEHTQALIDRMREQDTVHRTEVQSLLQRIQAPEIAVMQHQMQNLPDENPYPLTDEESAEAQNERQRMIAELERIETAGLV